MGICCPKSSKRFPNSNEIRVLEALKTKHRTPWPEHLNDGATASASSHSIASSPHVELLTELWKFFFPQKAFSFNSIYWLGLGFSSAEPVTELRPSGLLGIECLMYFCRQQPAMAREMGLFAFQRESSQDQKARKSKFPFAATLLKIADGLIAQLNVDVLQGGRGFERRNYWPLFSTVDSFSEMFCTVVIFADAVSVCACCFMLLAFGRAVFVCPLQLLGHLSLWFQSSLFAFLVAFRPAAACLQYISFPALFRAFFLLISMVVYPSVLCALHHQDARSRCR